MRSVARAMRAVVVSEFGGPEVLKVQSNLPIPQPTGNQVLVKVEAAGVNPVDTYIRTGTHTIKPTLPYTPGKDTAGVVELAGPAATRYRKGDRVYSMGSVTGAYAEYSLIEEKCLFPLADSLSFRQGAALGVPYFTAYRALVLKGKARPGETVLVHGASGAVGLASVQLAHAYGLTVLGTAGTEEGMALVRRNGADLVFNHREDGYQQKIMAAVKGGGGVNIILEMLANVNLQRDLEMLGVGGRVMVIGNRGTIEINPRLAMTKETSIIGIMGNPTQAELDETEAALHAGMAGGWVDPQVGAAYGLEEAAQSHAQVINQTATLGKIVIDTHS